MRARDFRLVLLLALPLVFSLSGCSDGDPVTGGAADPAVVQAAAAPAAVAASDSEVASASVVGLLSRLTPLPLAGGSQAPSTSGSSSRTGVLQSAVDVPTTFACPSAGQLENGLDFTCAEEGETFLFSFSGTVASPGGSVSLEGTLAASPAAEQPGPGIRYDLELSASAAGPRGSATWSGTGFATLDGAGQVVDYRLTVTHTVSSTQGGSAVAVVTVTPDSLNVLVSVGGVSIRFLVDRTTSSGTVEVNGALVAHVTIVEGCMILDYLDSSRPDDTVCPG